MATICGSSILPVNSVLAMTQRRNTGKTMLDLKLEYLDLSVTLSITNYVILNRLKFVYFSFLAWKMDKHISRANRRLKRSRCTGRRLVHCKMLYLYKVIYLSLLLHHGESIQSYMILVKSKEKCIHLKLNHYCTSLLILSYFNYDALILDSNYISRFTYSIK